MNTNKYLVILLFLSSVFFSSVSQANNVKIGIVEEIEGIATATNLNNSRELEQGSDIFLQDVVKTADNSIAIITLKNGSQIALNVNSEIMIKEYALTDEPNAVIEQKSGSIFSAVSQFFSKRSNSYKVQTHSAIVGVKGTKFTTNIVDNVTEIFVEEGVVEVSSVGIDVDPVVLNRNQTTKVEVGKAPEAAKNTVPKKQIKKTEKKKAKSTKKSDTKKTDNTKQDSQASKETNKETNADTVEKDTTTSEDTSADAAPETDDNVVEDDFGEDASIAEVPDIEETIQELENSIINVNITLTQPK